MKIIEAEFDGYLRIALTGASYFYFKPTEVTQVFLGTNGSGKSSLLNDFFPFPSNSEDFLPNGFKRIKYEHNNKLFEIKSSFNPTFHSFKIETDGQWIELNESGKQTIQLELAKTHFGVTPEIRDYLMGNKLFTELRPLERRDIFTQMSDADYTFGLKLFNEAKTKVRDITGAIKFIKERISRESIKLITKEEHSDLLEIQSNLHKELDKLYQQRNNNLFNSDKYKDKEFDLLSAINNISHDILKLNINLPHESKFNNIGDINNQVISLDKEKYALKQLLESKSKTFNQLVKEKELLTLSGGEGLEGVTKRIKSHQEQLKNLTQHLRYPWQFRDATVAYSAFKDIFEELTTIFSSLRSNEEKYFSNTTLNRLRQKREELTRSEIEQENLSKKYFFEIQHQNTHKEKPATKCPNCSFSWVIGFNEKHLNELLEAQKLNEEQLSNTKALLKKTDEEISEVMEFLNNYLRYTRIRSSYPILNPLWEQMDFEDTSFIQPGKALAMIQSLHFGLDTVLEIDTINKSIEKDRILETALKQTDLQNVEKVSKTINDLELEISTITNELRTLNISINELTILSKDLTQLESKKLELENLVNKAHENNDVLLKAYFNDYVNESIRLIQSQLASVEQKVNFAQTQVSLVEDLSNSLIDQEALLNAYRVIVKELSPTEGLIAEGLTGFIKAYVNQMNHFLASSWSYELEVLPCSVEKEDSVDLDYKFPLKLKNRTKPLSDVKFGSKGIRGIINLAFRIVMIKYLRLVDIPLFLDEFGDGLDDHHRTSSTQAITRVSEQLGFNQVFIISHYIETYGSIANSEICVLDNTNLTIDMEHNKHVVLR